MNLNEIYESDYLKANVNVKQGDVIKLLDEGSAVADGKGKIKLTFKAECNGKQKFFTINATNRKALQKLYGSDTKNWVGKEAIANIIKVTNPSTGELTDSIALSRPGSYGDGEANF